MALGGLGWVATTDGFAGEVPPVSLTLEVDDELERGSMLEVAMLIPDAEILPSPSTVELEPPPQPKKKRRSKLKFGRMDAY